MDDRPIGVFDSGFGGLTVARALIDLLPNEDLVYIADTGRYPYGPRPLTEVREFASQITDALVRTYDVKMVVVACNTAAAAALALLRFEYDVPLIGVIDPGIRAAVTATRNGCVGVIGTVGTISSGAYQRAIAGLRVPVTLTCAACPGFVEFVERGDTSSDQVHVLAERLLAPLRDARVDTLLLGCTHYPFLARTIGDVLGREVVLVSSAEETAFEVRSILIDTGLGKRDDGGGGQPWPVDPLGQVSWRPPGLAGAGAGRSGKHRWVSSGDVDIFATIGRRLFGPEIDAVETWVPGGDGDDRWRDIW
jgi:glutamate racemase